MSTAESYPFRDGVAGFFDLPFRAARHLVPRHLVPLERRPGGAVLSVASFDFHTSPVGPYGEIVLSIVVAPLVVSGRELPKAALYPFVVATTTTAAREHGIARWKLPHFPEDVGIDFRREPGVFAVSVVAAGTPVLEMTVTGQAGMPVKDLYQVFVEDEHLAEVLMEGESSEHEEGTGSLSLRAHPLLAGLDVEGLEPSPFREQWIRAGMETFHPVVPLAALRRGR